MPDIPIGAIDRASATQATSDMTTPEFNTALTEAGQLLDYVASAGLFPDKGHGHSIQDLRC